VVKRIARYLLKTKDKGLAHSPTGLLALDMYINEDFVG
jgi:hypothetical protein